MGIPLIQKLSIAKYIITRKLSGVQRFPLVLMLEPLFRCNLSCLGCGKIHYPKYVLNKSLKAEECFEAAEQCRAPVVSIAGGEPFLHEDMPAIVRGLIQRKKFVYLCTNGLLLKKLLSEYKPSRYLTFSIHLDGNREWHDRITGRPGLYETVMDSLQLLKARGFQFTINCTVYRRIDPKALGRFFDHILALGAQGITLSPAFDFPGNTQHDLFLRRDQSKMLFREIFKEGKDRNWKFNHSGLFLDFLSGNRTYMCNPWGNVTRNVLGWQRPCYLLAESYASDFSELMKKTDWNAYGPGRHPRCFHCMLHSGFESAAVNDAFSHPLRAILVSWRGPRTTGSFAPDPANTAGGTQG